MAELLDPRSPPSATFDTFDWDKAFGVGGSLLIEVTKTYDFDRMHRHNISKNGFDGNARPMHLALLFHWGDIEAANSVADKHFRWGQRNSGQGCSGGTENQVLLSYTSEASEYTAVSYSKGLHIQRH